MSQQTDGLPPLREVIARLQLSARKSMGQNYILDFNILRRIAVAGGPLAGVHVVEVGPGPGGLTRALFMEGAETVTVIERDDRFRPVHDEIAQRYPGRLKAVFADALDVSFQDIAHPGTRVIANLPYNLATQLLVGWLGTAQWPPWYGKLVLMFQREVAERITAGPGTKNYGRLAVLAQWRAEVRPVLQLRPQVFTPPPKVASTLVKIVPRASPEKGFTVEHLEKLTKAAFGQRRKMLRSSLRQITSRPEDLLAAAGISPDLRAETLRIEEFARLARALALAETAR